MDKQNIDDLDKGVQSMCNMLMQNQFIINHKWIGRLMRVMDKAIYPRKNQTKIVNSEKGVNYHIINKLLSKLFGI